MLLSPTRVPEMGGAWHLVAPPGLKSTDKDPTRDARLLTAKTARISCGPTAKHASHELVGGPH